MSTSRPNRSRKLIVILAVTCGIAGLCASSASHGMRQNDLDEQLFTAIQHGHTSELRPLLEQGADPNYFPRTSGDELGFSALLTSLRQGRVALHVSHGMPILGYVLNGFSHPHPMTALRARQLKAMHVLPNPVTCTDALGKLRILLEHHADPKRSYLGSYPLLQAVGENQTDAVQLLLEHGADPDVPAASGITARQYASRFNNAAILALLNAKTGHKGK